MEYDHESDDGYSGRPNKSAAKREMQALQELARQLVELAPSELSRLSLPERVQVAVEEFGRIKAREAIRRHMSYLAKLLRDYPVDGLEELLGDREKKAQLETARFRRAEMWRERLIRQPDTLQDLVSEAPALDAASLKPLIEQAAREKASGVKSKGAGKTLFRLLFEAL